MTTSSLNIFICTGLCKPGCECVDTSWERAVTPKWNLFPLQVPFHFHQRFMRSKAASASFLNPTTSHQTGAAGLPTQGYCESSAPWSHLDHRPPNPCFKLCAVILEAKSMPCWQSSITVTCSSGHTLMAVYPESCLPTRFELKQQTSKNRVGRYRNLKSAQINSQGIWIS